MGLLLGRLLLWCAAVVMGTAAKVWRAEDSRLPDIKDQDFISQCVDAHNQYRSNVNPTASDMFYMTWDEALAVTARAWARHCKRGHNPRLDTPWELHPTLPSVGENIWAGAPHSIFSVRRAIQSWHGEVALYNYAFNNCSGVCGHYTQVVWARSYKVGCAVQACPDGWAVFVCNYGDKGNYMGARPFATGQPCSRCSGGTCEDKLCRDAERDRLKRYDWTPSWDPGAGGASSCLAVLVARPLSIALVFVGVYGLQMLYPNLFAYE